MNVKNVISKAKTNFKTKVVPAVVSAGVAASTVAVSASAESVSAGSVDYKSLGETLVKGFSDIITACVDVAVAVVPLGLGLIGLSMMFSVAKKFFMKATH